MTTMEAKEMRSITYIEEGMKIENLKNVEAMKTTMVSNEKTSMR